MINCPKELEPDELDTLRTTRVENFAKNVRAY